MKWILALSIYCAGIILGIGSANKRQRWLSSYPEWSLLWCLHKILDPPNSINSLASERYWRNFASLFSKLILRIDILSTSVKLISGKCHRTNIGSGNGLRLGVVRQQAIIWTNIDQDLCCPMVFLGISELTGLQVTKFTNANKHHQTSVKREFASSFQNSKC